MIRLATKNDIERLVYLRNLQQKEIWKDKYQDNNFKLAVEKFFNYHLSHDLYLFVYENEDNEIISTAGIQFTDYIPDCVDHDSSAYLCNVYTLEEYRNNGISSTLIKKCIEFCKSNEVSEIFLTTHNEKAVKMYEKLGFKKDDISMIYHID